jgi:hypothetical protein
MGRVKEQMLWRSEHATDWEEDLPSWYQYHERELDYVVGNVIIYNVSYAFNQLLSTEYADDLIDISYKYENLYGDDGGEPELVEALEHWIVEDWFADELKKRGELVGDMLGMTVWGRQTSGQAISLDYVVQDVLKDIVERRKANDN